MCMFMCNVKIYFAWEVSFKEINNLNWLCFALRGLMLLIKLKSTSAIVKDFTLDILNFN